MAARLRSHAPECASTAGSFSREHANLRAHSQEHAWSEHAEIFAPEDDDEATDSAEEPVLLRATKLDVPLTALRRELVGPSELRREDVSLVDGGAVALLALAFGPPRLWGYLLDTAFDAFHQGYWHAGEVSSSSQVHLGMRAATEAVRANVDALIDRCGADVALLALTLEENTLQVQASGPLHAYVARRKGLRRLGPRMLGVQAEERADGLLSSHGATCVEQLEAGDLVFAGSRRVCHDAALQRVTRMLERDHFSLARTTARFQAASPEAVLALLSASAGEQGHGAATLAFRMPSF